MHGQHSCNFLRAGVQSDTVYTLLCYMDPLDLQAHPVAASVASAAANDEEYADSDFDEQLDPAAAKSGKRQLRGASVPHQSKKTKKG